MYIYNRLNPRQIDLGALACIRIRLVQDNISLTETKWQTREAKKKKKLRNKKCRETKKNEPWNIYIDTHINNGSQETVQKAALINYKRKRTEHK